MTHFFIPEDGHVFTKGRTFYDQGKLHLTWIASGFSLTVKGTSRALISFDKYDCEQEGYIRMTLDGRSQVHAISSGTRNVVALFGPGASHVLKVERITEGEKDMVISGITLYGKNPELLVKAPAEKTKVEFIGDSLTCGYGNLGEASTPVYRSFEQDCTQAYSGLTAEMLDMEYRIIAVSGKGLSHNWDGSTEFLIPEFYRYVSRETKEDWDFSKWTPDLVVINAGTNDEASDTPDSELIPAAKAFVEFVRKCYPNAYIVYAYGFDGRKKAPSLGNLINGMAQTDSKLFFFEFGDVYGKPEEKGANGHPNVRSHQRAAKELSLFLLGKGIVKKR